jgi:hypothetical protein
MPGVSGVTVVTNARVFYTTRAAAGASGARHSLRPLISRAGRFRQTSRETRGEIARVCRQMMLFENLNIRSSTLRHSFRVWSFGPSRNDGSL